MSSATMNLQIKVNQYFKTMNPLAAKIGSDIDDITDTYAQLWNKFTPDEQTDVINVTLIRPDIVLKYFNDISNDRQSKKRRSSAMLSKDNTTIITDTDADADEEDDDEEEMIDLVHRPIRKQMTATTTTMTTTTTTTATTTRNTDRLSMSSSNSNSYRSNEFSHIYLYNGKDLYTYNQIITALRYNQDDSCGIYRDEHSEPFNMKTKSQMNLNFGGTAVANAKIERAQKKYAEIKLSAVSGLDDMKKNRIDHVPELCAKLASMNKSNGNEHAQDGNVVRKSFMSKLFNSKANTLPIKMPTAKDVDQVDSLTGINLIMDASIGKDFDSMSTKSAGSCDKADNINDMSRLIDTNDTDDDNNTDLNRASMLDKSLDFDFLNNW